MAAQLRISIAGLTNIPKSAAGVLHKPKSVYEVISRLPNDGIGQRITQARLGFCKCKPLELGY
jgi:hypothetical protein